MKSFQNINIGYQNTFQPNRMSIGLVVPIENYDQQAIPRLENHLERIQLAEQLGFRAVWLRDVPFQVPSFGDAGQTFDPFTYLGFLAGQTQSIALGVASIALPLHHPVHVAKSAHTIDQLSKGRLIMGVASGDRPDEYPAMHIPFEQRDELFRNAFEYIRKSAENYPTLKANHFGQLNGQMDILPKPYQEKIPMLITGSSRQSLEWNAEHGDGWLYYPRNLSQQAVTIKRWRELVAQYGEYDKPFVQPLYVDLHPNDDFLPQPIPLGFRTGANHLTEYFEGLQSIGVNHVGINLRFNQENIESSLEKLAEKVLPQFHHTFEIEV